MVKPIKRTNKKRLGPQNVSNVCESPGAYIILNRNGTEQYVGSSENLRRRLLEHLNQKDISDARSFRTYRTKSTVEARRLERQLYKKYRPRQNIRKP